MKKGLKIKLIVLGILVLVVLGFLGIYYLKTKFTVRAVVVRVYDESSAIVMGIGNFNGLYSIGIASEDAKFKQGQEIEIYFDGLVLETYPGQLSGVKKIKIIKEESNISIPENILRFCYSSTDNVDVVVTELTNKGISIKITDTNELPYSYLGKYIIYKYVKNKEYTGVGYKIGEETGNSTAGNTRNRI